MTTTTRRLTTRQLAAKLAEIDAQIASVENTLAGFEAIASNATTGIPEMVGEAWNHLHDAHRLLTEHRAEVAANPRPIPPAEMGTWALVQQNID